MNYVFIGDVHSQYSKFKAAVDWVQENIQDYHIIQGGDLFDSRCDESNSAGVYELVRSLGDNITVINSNHLYKMHRVMTNPGLEYRECLQRTLDDFANYDKNELIEWLESLPMGVVVRSNDKEYRICHAFWNNKLYVPNEFEGIYKVFVVSSKAKGQMLYGLKKRGEDNESVRWWEEDREQSFVRVAFHYHTISIGENHLVLDGSCGDDGGVLPIYVVNSGQLLTF
jgi:hypothetical protein